MLDVHLIPAHSVKDNFESLRVEEPQSFLEPKVRRVVGCRGRPFTTSSVV